MNTWSLFWLSLGGAGVALLSAMAAKVLDELSWHELQEYCRLHKQSERFDDIHDRADAIVVTTESLQLLGTLVALLAAGGWLLGSHSDPAAPSPTIGRWLLVLGGAALVFLILTVWIPREVARRWGPPYLVHTWRIWRAADMLLKPLHLFSAPVRVVLHRLDDPQPEPSEEEALEDEILSIVAEGQHDGLLEADVREMIEGVIELDDTDVADIMTPRSEVDAIPVDMEWSEMVNFVVEAGRTRIPVYGKNLDDIIGVLYAKDLLAVLSADDPQRDVREILREARKVPRSTRLDELLQMFLQNRNHLAIVVDEFLHVVGLVTIEDVLEEIVGEIVDEHDKEEVGEIRRISEHVVEIHARAHLHDINEALGTQFPEDEEYDTLGGFLLSQLCRIPEPGEVLEWQDLRLVVLEATRRRVERVRLELQRGPKTLAAH